jgi:Tfp pilus assembly protein PilF
VSQLFDSLRRGRGSSDRANSTRTAHGDALLSTLGYTPGPRRSGLASVVLAVVLLLGLGVAGWLGWHNYLGDTAGPDAATRAPAPSLPQPTPSRPPDAAGDPLPESPPVMRSSPAAKPQPSLPTAHTQAPSSAVSRDSDLERALYYHRAGDYANALQRYRALLDRDDLNAQAHNNLGLLYQEQGQLQESARELQRAIAIDPRNSGTHNNYGVTWLMLGRSSDAAAEFQSALTLDPANLDALVNLALVDRSAGRLDAAKERLLEALNRAPGNAAAHYNLAQLYDQTNEAARAVEHYRLFLEHAGAEHADRAPTVRARIAALTRIPE